MGQMDGKVVLITGATNGIGKVTARELAKMGASVLIVGRNPSKTRDVMREIQKESGNNNVDMLTADLSIISDIRGVAADFRERYDRLDVLINNAGAFFSERKSTPDGYERTFALNHLSYFLLTNLLLDMLKASAPSRVINTSSGAHMGAPKGMNFDDLQGEKSFGGWGAYSQSKLANILFTYELAQRLNGTQVTANSLHPGFVNTGFGKNNGGIIGAALNLVTPLMGRTPEKGAETLIYLAASPEVEGVTGKYFSVKKESTVSSAARDPQQAQRLWTISEELTGINAAVV